MLSTWKIRLTLRFYHWIYWLPFPSCWYWPVPVHVWFEWTILLYFFDFSLRLQLISLFYFFSIWFSQFFPSLFTINFFWTLIDLRLESTLFPKLLFCLLNENSWAFWIRDYFKAFSHFMTYCWFEISCICAHLCHWWFFTAWLFLIIVFQSLIVSWFRRWFWVFTTRTTRTLGINLWRIFKISELILLILHFFSILGRVLVCFIVINIL